MTRHMKRLGSEACALAREREGGREQGGRGKREEEAVYK
jgi:hypothetical protein